MNLLSGGRHLVALVTRSRKVSNSLFHFSSKKVKKIPLFKLVSSTSQIAIRELQLFKDLRQWVVYA